MSPAPERAAPEDYDCAECGKPREQHHANWFCYEETSALRQAQYRRKPPAPVAAPRAGGAAEPMRVELDREYLETLRDDELQELRERNVAGIVLMAQCLYNRIADARADGTIPKSLPEPVQKAARSLKEALNRREDLRQELGRRA